jgi:rhomboid protease GluP
MSSPSFGRRAAQPAPSVTIAISETESAPPPWAFDSGPVELPYIPLATLAIIALLTVIYLAEQAFGFEHGVQQTYRSLLAFGAVSGDLVLKGGQWWRPVTAMLLHGGVGHLVGNCVALLIAGMMLERRIGGVWFAAIFVLGGLAGSAASITSDPPATISVGASGAIMALLVPALIEAFGNETPYTPKIARSLVLLMVVSALIPSSGHIDYTAHAGGALAGGVLGYALLFAIPQLQDSRLGQSIGIAAVAGGALVAMACFAVVALGYPAYAARNAALIPDREFDKIHLGKSAEAADAIDAQSIHFLDQYPQDPRGHLLRAVILLNANRLSEGEDELRTGMAQHDVLSRDFPMETEQYMHGLLARIMMAEGRQDEARAEAQSICDQWTVSAETAQLQNTLAHDGVCPWRHGSKTYVVPQR